jgi:DNA (cytosine-5)-methyltransferase 1
MGTQRLTFLEFFAGGGMARAGLGGDWRCLLANDVDRVKAAAYRANWGDADLIEGDIRTLDMASIGETPDLAWASFPCQDLSLAGAGAGLKGARSGLFWTFHAHLSALRERGCKPRSVVIENVCGLLTSHGGADFAAIYRALAALDYRVGALVIDAVDFLPQSRPRLFFVALDQAVAPPVDLVSSQPAWGAERVAPVAAQAINEQPDAWLWWRLPPPPPRTARLIDLMETWPTGTAWHSPEQTHRLLEMMTPLNRAKVARAELSGRPQVGAVYRRTRPNPDGDRGVRAEVRFDDISGCLRTASGGSSRQVLLFVDGGSRRSRLLSPREAARLMGLPDDYKLPARYNDAYHLAGDGVAVPVVRHLARYLLEPALRTADARLMRKR